MYFSRIVVLLRRAKWSFFLFGRDFLVLSFAWHFKHGIFPSSYSFSDSPQFPSFPIYSKSLSQASHVGIELYKYCCTTLNLGPAWLLRTTQTIPCKKNFIKWNQDHASLSYVKNKHYYTTVMFKSVRLLFRETCIKPTPY